MIQPVPGLFGQNRNNSSRDYTTEYCWGKNQFNSSFPASLVAYMCSKGILPVYLCTDENNRVVHEYISATDLFRIDPLSEYAFYNFETSFPAYDKFYTGEREKIDLVMLDTADEDKPLIGLEIKLTALPDSTTRNLSEERYSCEIVVRPPTINFIACSICNCFKSSEEKDVLRNMLNMVPRINHWEEPEEVLPHYDGILKSILNVCSYLQNKQTPLIIQPIWKTRGGKSILSDDCLDVFVWSNLAVIQMCNRRDSASKRKITRPMRAIIWIYLMLLDYTGIYGQFDYRRIVRLHSYNIANDKAYALSGTQTYEYLKCAELEHPRISKYEIKNIILGGGQNLLSPERRFDAVIVNSPDLFEE
ncbi:HindVP family restriction endonuclease [uncultured Muribaculum sp.]|uniref:HindVP family restriction endonuclease n=1 Tax=uncultured Muribaculum sp. TaxID=1918613 RepID=UPI002635ED75|nr:HindVP family restriction endonuclease [uncultured Muribaculum sp.]